MRLLLVVLAIVVALPAQAESRRSFKDWTASCDDAGYCSAASGPNLAPDAPKYTLVIARHAAQTYWEIALDTRNQPAGDYADIIAAVDGRSEVFAANSEAGSFGQAGMVYFLGDKAQILMDGLVPGTEVRFDFNDGSDTARSARFALSGLSAAMLWIDEQQGRLGSERVASSVPHGLAPAGASSAPPVGIPAELIERMAADPECEPMHTLANRYDSWSDPALAPDRTLYILPCWSGAYNFGWKVFVGGYGSYDALAFADYSETLGWTGATSLANVDYDPATKTLTAYYKGRGLGDCGSSGIWRWHEYGFRMLEFRAKEACDGEGEPMEFPVVFSAEPLPDAPAQ